MAGTQNHPGVDTARIAALFASQIKAARRELLWQMESAGLRAEEGWRIHEELVNTPEGTAFRLSPVHRTHSTPDHLVLLVSLK